MCGGLSGSNSGYAGTMSTFRVGNVAGISRRHFSLKRIVSTQTPLVSNNFRIGYFSLESEILDYSKQVQELDGRAPWLAVVMAADILGRRSFATCQFCALYVTSTDSQ